MAKKAKKKINRMPPLSVGDRLIYWGLFLIIVAANLAVMALPFWIWYRKAFADETVAAASITAGIIWGILPTCVSIGVTFGLWGITYQKQLPIFGKRNFKYGPPAWPKVYPLFMKDKPYVWVSKRAVQARRRNAVILLVLVVAAFIPYPLSWFGRQCIRYDGSVIQYNGLNIKTRDFSSGQIEKVEFEAYIHKKSKRNLTRVGDVHVILTTDSGKRYVFDHDEFRGCIWTGDNGWLPAMLELKDRYRPEIITYTGAEYLEKVILDNQLSPQQQADLYELFSVIQ